ncbi:hypothetical protein B0H67DRAFT_77881 [Lasiosphaeris hirsuta]|uniref:Uncharacterized protein n=1 Tax=Lasiosphaeris hirsuta TaxID=260670 RepID=A0AA40BC38_9PEZI|nr:hypothetical protein B0H67DRAFT_77881 [Lasiosphaeris hirsuta]
MDGLGDDGSIFTSTSAGPGKTAHLEKGVESHKLGEPTEDLQNDDITIPRPRIVNWQPASNPMVERGFNWQLEGLPDTPVWSQTVEPGFLATSTLEIQTQMGQTPGNGLSMLSSYQPPVQPDNIGGHYQHSQTPAQLGYPSNYFDNWPRLPGHQTPASPDKLLGRHIQPTSQTYDAWGLPKSPAQSEDTQNHRYQQPGNTGGSHFQPPANI